MTQPTCIVLPIPLANQLLQYLGARPYSEVAALVDALRRCPGADLVPPPAAADAPAPSQPTPSLPLPQ